MRQNLLSLHCCLNVIHDLDDISMDHMVAEVFPVCQCGIKVKIVSPNDFVATFSDRFIEIRQVKAALKTKIKPTTAAEK